MEKEKRNLCDGFVITEKEAGMTERK